MLSICANKHLMTILTRNNKKLMNTLKSLKKFKKSELLFILLLNV